MPAGRPLRTRDGAELTVRAIEPGDRDALQVAVRELSPESRYRRFLGPMKELQDRELTRLTEIDHRDHEALIALDASGRIVGVARYVRLADRPEAAEVAVAILDEWQGRGVGTALLTELIAAAESAGVETFVASCLATNSDMILLFRELGESVRRTGSGSGVVELEIVLPTDSPDLVGPALRAAAAAPSLTAARPHPALGGEASAST